MFKKGKYDEIVVRLNKRKKEIVIEDNFNGDYVWICNNLSDNEISLDHKLLSYEKAEKVNTEYREAFEEMTKDKWIFAETGQGDLWLVDLTNADNSIYFYNHDLSSVVNMSLNMKEWFELADLLSQKEELFNNHRNIYFDENLNLRDEYRQQIIAEVEKIKKGLSSTYPFEL
ncbi:SMI1/KNR4 family protein [Cohnella terricola]|uniref:SMI1/KNR4 family protein n=1 Tax=Cohnella terricola TaxID=1289167 RepID=A0A559JQB7_9BACL|nr:SMI1/KNR4 family protein [Cohnella terricola]TVY02060.1 SMI1/KNR4 family protein [Cohnella terricola]